MEKEIIVTEQMDTPLEGSELGPTSIDVTDEQLRQWKHFQKNTKKYKNRTNTHVSSNIPMANYFINLYKKYNNTRLTTY